MKLGLHAIALKEGADYAQEYEYNGLIEPSTYTVTLTQLEAIFRAQAHASLINIAASLKATPMEGKIGDWHKLYKMGEIAEELAEIFMETTR
jgi:hypothetical protein